MKQKTGKKYLKLVSSIFTLLVAKNVAAQEYSAFSLVDKSYTTSKDGAYAENLARTYSSDTFSNCNGVSAALILDTTNCRTQKVKDCKKLPDENSFSRLDITRYSQSTPDTPQYRSYFSGLYGAGSAKTIIRNIYSHKMPVASQQCVSLDKLLVNFGDSKQLLQAQELGWQKLKEAYEGFKNRKPNCPTCDLDYVSTARSEIAENFNIKKDNAEILKAFSQDTYDKFLEKLFIPAECSKIDNVVSLESTNSLKVDGFPKDELEVSNYEDSMKTIKAVLGKKLPILVDNVCLGRDFDIKKTQETAHALISAGAKVKSSKSIDKSVEKGEVCSGQHSVVISGYRRICKNTGTPSEQCRETLKIENTWGEAWQKQHDDGWVDAKSFMDRTAYLGQNLLWIEDRPKN